MAWNKITKGQCEKWVEDSDESSSRWTIQARDPFIYSVTKDGYPTHIPGLLDLLHSLTKWGKT